jgi:hypothetical protein
MLRALARFPSAVRSQRDVVEMHRELLRGWGVRVETLCEDVAAVRAAPRVIFANLNQLGHAGAVGAVVATDEVLEGKKEVPFIVNLGWKLFPLVGWVSHWRYTIVRQVPGHGRRVLNRVAEDFRSGAISACYMSVEGVRARHPDAISPYRKGCAHLALSADAAIVPVVMSRSCFHFWPFGSPLPRVEPTGGVARFKFLRPISCQGKSVSEITDHLRSLAHSFD